MDDRIMKVVNFRKSACPQKKVNKTLATNVIKIFKSKRDIIQFPKYFKEINIGNLNKKLIQFEIKRKTSIVIYYNFFSYSHQSNVVVIP